MSDNLYELLHGDFVELADLIALALSDSNALRQTQNSLSELEWGDAAALLAKLNGNTELLRQFAFLSIGSDCLRRVKQAILADEEIAADEVEVAFTIVGPIANCFARNLDRYSQYSDIEVEDLLSFLLEFEMDSELFGGAQKNGFLGVVLCVTACVFSDDSDALDIYEHVTITILDHIMREGGLDSHERALLKDARAYFRSTRQEIESLKVQLANRRPMKSSPRKKPTFDSPFTIKEAIDIAPSEAEVRVEESNPEAALQAAIADLESLIGLPGVKEEVKRLMSFLKIQQERRKHGLRESGQTLHFVFTGNPGTGKTTVARIVSKILCGFGLLKTAKVVECDRSDLVGGYLGQTAIKTDEVIMSALDGVLFIDEAYSLSDAFQHDMYGQEAINTLLKRMEDHRDRLVVIAAGYPKPMDKFLRTNPGLESRFTRKIRFEDYSVADLCLIFAKLCKDAEYSLTPNCRAHLCLLFTHAHSQRDERFGNARFVRNVFEQSIARHSQRSRAPS